MSLFDSASLVVTPNGYKAGKLYSIKPSDGAGDLDVVRATSATRVNSLGLIESVGNNVARLDYSNGSCPSILVEPQRTNLLTYSSSFDNADWNKSNISVTANSTDSPSGVQDADTLTKSTAGVEGIMNHYVTASASNYTGSVYIKKDSNQTRFPEIFLRSSNDNGENEVYVQLNTATGATAIRYQNGTAVVNPPILVNGYWRVTITIPGTSNNCRVGIRPAAGTTLGVYDINATGSVVAWGFQLEAATYATSYIPTTSATVTRNADVISKTGISDLIGQTEGTLFCDVFTNSIENSDFQTFVSVYGDINNRVVIGKGQGTSNLFYFVNSNGSTTFQIITNPLGRYKIALAYKNGDSCLYINGVNVFTSSNAINFGTTLSYFYINQRPVGFEIGSLNLYSTALWKTRISNAELATLTTL